MKDTGYFRPFYIRSHAQRAAEYRIRRQEMPILAQQLARPVCCCNGRVVFTGSRPFSPSTPVLLWSRSILAPVDLDLPTHPSIRPHPGTSSFNNVNNICLLLRACLAGCVFVCLSVVYLAVCLLVLLPVCFFIWVLRCLLVKEFFMTFSALRHRSVHWSVHPSVHLSVCVSICPPSCLSCSSV